MYNPDGSPANVQAIPINTSGEQPIPVVIATPVNTNPYGSPPQYYSDPAANVPYASSYPPPPVYYAPPAQAQPYYNPEPPPICRGCGRQFVRPAGISNADARYFRCEQCNQLTIENFCTIS